MVQNGMPQEITRKLVSRLLAWKKGCEDKGWQVGGKRYEAYKAYIRMDLQNLFVDYLGDSNHILMEQYQ